MRLSEIVTPQEPKEGTPLYDFLRRFETSTWKRDSNGVINVKGHLHIWGFNGEEFPVQFGTVDSDFSCHNSDNLKSFKGFPHTVHGEFNMNASPVPSMVGGPTFVGDGFTGSFCGGLKNLKGSPRRVEKEGWSMAYCHNLESLEGGPDYVEGDFDIRDNDKLSSLVGSPKVIEKGGLLIKDCKSLKSLDGITPDIGGSVRIQECAQLSSLSGLKKMNGMLIIQDLPVLNMLHVFKIKGLKVLVLHDNRKVDKIINKHLQNPDRMDGMNECQDELEEAGFGEYARLK